MWGLYVVGFAILMGGWCYYCPYQCMKWVAQGRHAARTWLYSTTSSQRWEGSATGGFNVSETSHTVLPLQDWLVCFRVFTTADGVEAYVPRDAERVPPRKNLPFFQTVVCLPDGEDSIDVSSSLSMFAYEGNDIGGTDFWGWFLLRFTKRDIASIESVRVLDAATFAERDLDLSTLLRL